MSSKGNLLARVSNFLDSHQSKSYVNVASDLQKKFPDVPQSDLKWAYNKINKNEGESSRVYSGHKVNNMYFEKIFSSSHNCWFHDIFVNDENTKPPYYHIFIGMNNHYAVCYPLYSRSEDAIKKSLEKFIAQEHPLRLASDKERAFESSMMKDLCQKHGIQLDTYNASVSHGPLRIIDRLCRTIRDMNHKQNLSKVHYVNDEDNSREKINLETMNDIINKYNNTFNHRIGMTPKEMYDDYKKYDGDMEADYIMDNLHDNWFKKEKGNKVKKRKHKRKFDDDEYEDEDEPKFATIKVGSWVRYIKPDNEWRKVRSRVSEGVYEVVKQEGNRYIIKGVDGTCRYFSRADLKYVRGPGPKPLKFKLGLGFKHKEGDPEPIKIESKKGPIYPTPIFNKTPEKVSKHKHKNISSTHMVTRSMAKQNESHMVTRLRAGESKRKSYKY